MSIRVPIGMGFLGSINNQATYCWWTITDSSLVNVLQHLLLLFWT